MGFALLGALVVVLVPSRILVGDDGVLWTHWLRSIPGKFVPYSRISGVDDSPKGATLVLTNGREIPFYTSGLFPEETDALRAEIRRRLAEWRALAGPPPTTASLVEDERDPYRSAHDGLTLMQLITNQTVDPDARIAAAKKFAPKGDDQARAVFRSLSAASAAPKVRALFAKIARDRV